MKESHQAQGKPGIAPEMHYIVPKKKREAII